VNTYCLLMTFENFHVIISVDNYILLQSDAEHIFLHFITRKMFGEQYRPLSSSLCSFSTPCYFDSLMDKYYPLHLIPKQTQPMLLLQCQGPSFTPIQMNMQSYSSVCLNFYIFGYQTGRQKILHRMAASIS